MFQEELIGLDTTDFLVFDVGLLEFKMANVDNQKIIHLPILKILKGDLQYFEDLREEILEVR